MTSHREEPVGADVLRLDAAGESLRALFDFLPDVQAWIKDRQGRYRWVNRGFLLNYSLERAEDAVGRTDYDLSPRHLADQFRQDDETVLAGQPVLRRVELVGRFDHTACWSITSKVPLNGPQGRIIATAGLTYPLRGEAPKQDYPDLTVGKVIGYIREQFCHPLANDLLARVAGVSVRALERKFWQAFRLSPQQYVRRVRVRMACHALVHTRQPISKIAAAHGFCDQSHFCREFRRQIGISPLAYRAAYQAGAEP